jgi:hypothetical protein
MSALQDEYKILQDKIDKIGAFRVTIKGWSVTATVAGLVAIASGKNFSPTATAAALDVLLAWFFWFEREQVHLGWGFNARARSIEIQIDKTRRAEGERVLFSTPNIARSIFGTKKRKEFIWHEFQGHYVERWRQWTNGQIRLAIGSDLVFYIVLGLAAWLPIWIKTPTEPAAAPVVIHDTIQMPSPPLPKKELRPDCPVTNNHVTKRTRGAK